MLIIMNLHNILWHFLAIAAITSINYCSTEAQLGQNQNETQQTESNTTITTPVPANNTSVNNASTTNTTDATTTIKPQTPPPTTIPFTLPPWKQRFIHIATMIPQDTADDKCTREAIQMAIEDVNRIPKLITFNGTTGKGRLGLFGPKEYRRDEFKLKPTYSEVNLTMSEAIDQLHNVYSNGPLKMATLGPPYKKLLNNFAEYSTVLASNHVSYTDANEPLELYYVFFVQTPPSIVYQFKAAAALMEHFGWIRFGILYDFSEHKYRKNAGTLRETIHLQNKRSGEADVLTELGIWSQVLELQDIRKKMDMLQENDRRIILSLVSVRGARLVFCEAYHRKMYKPKVVWIMFEQLPDGWAKTMEGGNTDVNCTEDELLTAADGYIFIVKQGLRIDNVTSIGGVTTDMFKNRLQKAVGPGVKCDENVAYAYDAVWVLAKGYEKVAQKTWPGYFTYHNFPFSYFFVRELINLSFEALTGPIDYEEDPGRRFIYKRQGQIGLWVHKRGQKPIYLGTHHTKKNKLELMDNSTLSNTIFGSNTVPKDKAEYTYKYANFEKPLIITMWLIACFGTFMALVFLATTVVYTKDKREKMGSPILNVTIICGSILCYISVVIYGLDTRLVSEKHIPNICFVFMCTLSFGFTMTFGGLFAKTWGLYKTYLTPEVVSKQTEPKHIPEWMLLVMVGVFLLVDVIILITWGVWAPFYTLFQDVFTTANLFADTVNVEQVVRCNCDHFHKLLIGLCCYKGILLIFGIFLAWQTKNATFQCQNEAKHVAIAIYNVFAVSIIGMICVSVLLTTTKYQALYAIVAICIIICTTFTLLLVFVPKLRIILYPELEKVKENSKTGSMKNNEIYLRHSKRFQKRGSREISEVSSTFSNGTLNTQVSTDSTLQQDPKLHNNLVDTLSAASVISYPSSYLSSPTSDAQPTFPTVTAVQKMDSSQGSPIIIKALEPESEKKDRDSGFGDSPQIEHIVLQLPNEGSSTNANETIIENEEVKNEFLDIDDITTQSPDSVSQMINED